MNVICTNCSWMGYVSEDQEQVCPKCLLETLVEDDAVEDTGVEPEEI